MVRAKTMYKESSMEIWRLCPTLVDAAGRADSWSSAFGQNLVSKILEHLQKLLTFDNNVGLEYLFSRTLCGQGGYPFGESFNVIQLQETVLGFFTLRLSLSAQRGVPVWLLDRHARLPADFRAEVDGNHSISDTACKINHIPKTLPTYDGASYVEVGADLWWLNEDRDEDDYSAFTLLREKVIRRPVSVIQHSSYSIVYIHRFDFKATI